MNTDRQISTLSWPILLIVMFVMSAIHVSAETDSIANDSEVYMGLWLTEINDEAIYLLIKKNQIARYFYKDRIDNNVYKGTWKLDKENLLSISSLDFENLCFQLEDDSAEATPFKAEENVSTLVKVSEEILGEWARPADYEAPKNAYMPSTYFGLWETQDQKNPRLIQVLDNRTVISISKGEPSSNPQNILQGEWYKHGKQLHIAWEDGSYSILDNRNENSVKLHDFAPGEAIIEKPSDYSLITQSQTELEETYWPNDQLALKQQNNISLTQFDYKSLLKFYRGEWIILDETHPEALEIMKFNRFGGVDLASDKKIKGNWYLSGKGCLINLEDGIRMRLKYIGSAFLVFVYEANRPLDGYPNKILKSAPFNPQKLDLLNTEIYFTSKLLEQVELLKPKGNKGIPLISNWSNRETINPSPSSPWWWPIWSDNPKIKEADTFSENNASPSLTNTIDSIASNKESKQTNSPNPTSLPSKSKWEWPF
ncbi:MAG: hypothetical protein ACJZ8T_00465 [Coraliomargaritaceae bacterium]